jgi:hypothetical protein
MQQVSTQGISLKREYVTASSRFILKDALRHVSARKTKIASREEAVVADVTNRRVIGGAVTKQSRLVNDRVTAGV